MTPSSSDLPVAIIHVLEVQFIFSAVKEKGGVGERKRERNLYARMMVALTQASE